MTTTEQRLADALRFIAQGHYTAEGCQERAREALAAYDAQQAQPAADGAWVAEPITNVVSAPPIRGRAYREPVASCNSAEYAARIVQCVNAHDTLVSALRTILADKGSASFNDDLEAYDAAIQTASDALAQAGVHHA